jgi:hypothetical protein
MVAKWKNGFIKRPHKTANLNLPTPKVRVWLLFLIFCNEDKSVTHCKTLAS